MYVQTVNGQVAPESLGVTLAHEHLIIDFRRGWIEPPAGFAYLAHAEITSETAQELRRNPQYSQPNLQLDDGQVAVAELNKFRALGGNTIVDLTSSGLGPEPLKLRSISLDTGVNIVAGCGYYRHMTQSLAVLSMKSEQLVDEIIRSLQVGIGPTDVRAGIIGEVGASAPLHPFERESLIAASKAQRQTGVAINIHPDIWGFGHLDVLDILEAAGADLHRTVVSHMDEVSDTGWHCKIAERGVYLSFDTFGSEFSYGGIEEPRDSDRIICLLALLERGYVDRLLLSQDICYKMGLEKYGGHGYSHILLNIVPHLRKVGVSELELHKMLVENPRKILSISS